MDVKRIVDAGPLVAWLNQADQWHAWATEALAKDRGQLHTTEIVTVDTRDFRVYRRFRRDALPLLMP